MTSDKTDTSMYRETKQLLAQAASTQLTVPVLVLMLISSFTYMSLTLWTANVKPLWNDELFTFYIATLPTLSDTWLALATGAEQIPIFYYCIVRGVVWIMGPNPLWIRFISVISFLVACISIFYFLKDRIGPAYAITAAQLPVISPFYRFAYEARPYGLVLGLSGVALCCWQHSRHKGRRKARLLLLCSSLVLATGCHYYAVLFHLPLLLGESVRTALRKQSDVCVLIILLGAPVIALAASYPLIVSAAANVGAFWARVDWRHVTNLYTSVLVRTAPALGTAAALSIMVSPMLNGFSREPIISPLLQGRLSSALSPCEWTATIGFALLPVLGLALALVTGAFVDRYVISVVIGLSIVLTVPISVLFQQRRAEALVAAFLMIGPANFVGLHGLRKAYSVERNLQDAISALKNSGDERSVIVASETHTFLELSHYAPQGIKSRIVYLADPLSAARLLGHTSVENGMVNLVGTYLKRNVTPYDTFVARHCSFLLFGNISPWASWVVVRLKEDGKQILELTALPEQDKVLLRVSSRNSAECNSR